MKSLDLFYILVTLALVLLSYIVITDYRATTERITYLETQVSHLETNQARILKRIEWKYGLR